MLIRDNGSSLKLAVVVLMGIKGLVGCPDLVHTVLPASGSGLVEGSDATVL